LIPGKVGKKFPKYPSQGPSYDLWRELENILDDEDADFIFFFRGLSNVS
jgi:hypothetical protein